MQKTSKLSTIFFIKNPNQTIFVPIEIQKQTSNKNRKSETNNCFRKFTFPPPIGKSWSTPYMSTLLMTAVVECVLPILPHS